MFPGNQYAVRSQIVLVSALLFETIPTGCHCKWFQSDRGDIYYMLSRFTLDCFTSIAFGESVDSLSIYPAKHPFAEAFDRLIANMAIRHFIPHQLWEAS